MTDPTVTLVDAAREAVAAASHLYRGHPTARRCVELAQRLDGPLRLAVAGKVKAGKSTLLNALVGDRIAPVDAGECTRVVTWYRAAEAPRITLEHRGGAAHDLPVRFRDGALEIDLGGVPVADVERLVIGWPADDLRRFTLVDTPGIASLSARTSARAARLLTPADEAPPGATDAVLYLVRHLHTEDAGFLRAFRGAPRTGGVTTVAAVARADEIGGARVDALEAAADLAAGYRADPVVRGLCLDVVAVAGLLAETGSTMTAGEYDAVAALAELPPWAATDALRSADHFGSADVAGLDADRRARLMRRFGMFGLRLAVQRLRDGVDGPAALGAELVRRSGLPDLRSALARCLEARRDVLIARSVLTELGWLLREEPAPGTAMLAADVRRAVREAPELVELRTLGALRAGRVDLPPDLLAEGLAVLGDAGPSASERLGLPPGSGERQRRARAWDAARRWRERAENPVTDHSSAVACRTVLRAFEALASAV